MRVLVLSIVVALFSGCPTPAPTIEPDDEPTERRSPSKSSGDITVVGQPVAVSPQFSDCVPLGDTEELVGVVTLMDFSKTRRGVVIDDGTNKWVVSYSDENVFADFEKDRVLARGRQCEKQADGIRAYHFDVQSLRLIQ